MKKGIDFYSLTLEEIKSTGASFVCRYYSPMSDKNLTKVEAQDLSRLGVDIICVWETTSHRSQEGVSAGVDDAKQALANAKAAGQPNNRPIYFSVDFDTSLNPSVIEAYFQGVREVLPVSRIGAYGGISTISYLFNHKLISWGWQTEAWSYGKWDPRAQLRQVGYGRAFDSDEAITNDFGQWSLTIRGRVVNLFR